MSTAAERALSRPFVPTAEIWYRYFCPAFTS